MEHVLGIDLGTTNSCAAVIDAGQPVIVPISETQYTLPSVVSFLDNGEQIVGEAAKRLAGSNPTNTVIAAKRLIGRSYSDPDTKQAIASMPYRCIRGPEGEVQVVIREETFSVEHISAIILSQIKSAAARHIDPNISKAVITVPAYFNDRQRNATIRAGQEAGFEVLTVINEPTAAALAYGLQQGDDRNGVVFDLGGGTFDVSVLKIGGGVVEVLASAGDAFLGGHDFDHQILLWLLEQVNAKDGVDLSHDPAATLRLREAAEAAKIRLTDEESTRVALPFVATLIDGQPLHVDCELDRATFEGLVSDLVDRTIETFLDTLEAAKIGPSDIQQLLLVGGMTRMPAVRNRLRDLLSCEPSEGVHPDLVVAVGAAVHGASLTEQNAGAVLLDVTPHNLGILTVAGLVQTVIQKNTRVPAEATRVFSTVDDNQESVKIVVFQGDSRKVADNQILGDFKLHNIRAAPRGEVQIEVRFCVSADGIVTVTGTDVETGVIQEITVGAHRGG